MRRFRQDFRVFVAGFPDLFFLAVIAGAFIGAAA